MLLHKLERCLGVAITVSVGDGILAVIESDLCRIHFLVLVLLKDGHFQKVIQLADALEHVFIFLKLDDNIGKEELVHLTDVVDVV